jgi:hypothetical protein
MTEKAAAAGGGTKNKLQCACARVRRGTPACACARVRIGTQGDKKTEGAAIKKKKSGKASCTCCAVCPT